MITTPRTVRTLARTQNQFIASALADQPIATQQLQRIFRSAYAIAIARAEAVDELQHTTVAQNVRNQRRSMKR
jgi:hypothetical protein